MSQHDYVISNQSFPSFRQDLNNALSAIQTCNSGTSRPTGAVAGQIWLDTTSATSPTLKYYDGADDISLATLDHSANTVNWLDSTVSITGLTTTATGTVLTLTDTHLNSTVSIRLPNATAITDDSGNEYIKFAKTASAVNEVSVTNSATGVSPTISATGDDTNIGINLTPKGTGGIVLPAGAVGTPALTTSGDLNTGIFFPTADTIAFTEGGTEAMRIDSSGNVGIGTTNPVAPLHISRIGDGVYATNLGQTLSKAGFIINPESNGSSVQLNIAKGVGGDGIIYQPTNSSATGAYNNVFNPFGGDVLVGKTSTSDTVTGTQITSNGAIINVLNASGYNIINRQADDGTFIYFKQANSQEGSISVSGATVSYNGFTGSHWSRFIDESKPDVLRGTVMESLDQMTDWYNAEFEVSTTENDVVKTTIEKKPYALKAGEQVGDVITYAWNTGKKDENDNDIIEQVQATIVKEVDVKHVMSKISDTSEAKNVYGVFHAWDNDDLINNDFYVASVGSYVVRIKAGQTVNKGDLLQSNGDGTAKVQADDLVRASSFAKVLSNTVIETYEDGSFIVPCSLMC